MKNKQTPSAPGLPTSPANKRQKLLTSFFSASTPPPSSSSARRPLTDLDPNQVQSAPASPPDNYDAMSDERIQYECDVRYISNRDIASSTSTSSTGAAKISTEQMRTRLRASDEWARRVKDNPTLTPNYDNMSYAQKGELTLQRTMQNLRGKETTQRFHAYDNGFSSILQTLHDLNPSRNQLSTAGLRTLFQSRAPSTLQRGVKNWTREQLFRKHLEQDQRDIEEEPYQKYRHMGNAELKSLIQQRCKKSVQGRENMLRKLKAHDDAVETFTYHWYLQQEVSQEESDYNSHDEDNDVGRDQDLQQTRSGFRCFQAHSLLSLQHHTPRPRGLQAIEGYTTALAQGLKSQLQQHDLSAYTRIAIEEFSIINVVNDFASVLKDDAKTLLELGRTATLSDYLGVRYSIETSADPHQGLYLIFLQYSGGRLPEAYGGSASRSLATRVGGQHLNPQFRASRSTTPLYRKMKRAQSVDTRTFAVFPGDFHTTRPHWEFHVHILESLLLALFGLYPAHQFFRLAAEFQHISVASASTSLQTREDFRQFEEQRGFAGLNRSLPYLEVSKWGIVITEWLKLFTEGIYFKVERVGKQTSHVILGPKINIQLPSNMVKYLSENEINRVKIQAFATEDRSPHPHQWADLPLPTEPE